VQIDETQKLAKKLLTSKHGYAILCLQGGKHKTTCKRTLKKIKKSLDKQDSLCYNVVTRQGRHKSSQSKESECIKMTKVEMARTLQRIRKVQNDMDALKRELDGLKDTVKAEMVATGEHKVEAGGCIATYQEVTSNRFNSSALKAEDKATYDKYVVASTTARLTVK
jgi:hypothetical protein